MKNVLKMYTIIHIWIVQYIANIKFPLKILLECHCVSFYYVVSYNILNINSRFLVSTADINSVNLFLVDDNVIELGQKIIQEPQPPSRCRNDYFSHEASTLCHFYLKQWFSTDGSIPNFEYCVSFIIGSHYTFN